MTIVVINNSGIGNRIKNIVSAVRKGHLINDAVDIRCEHQSLFRVAQCVIVPRHDHLEVMSTWRLQLLPEENSRKVLRNPKYLVEYHDQNYQGSLGNTIDFQYANIERDVVEDFLRYFALILINQEVLDEADLLSSELEVQRRVGVHIRTWYDAPDRHSNLFDIQDYFRTLDRFADEKKFILCVDHETARRAILNRYGEERVLEPPNREIGHISVDLRSKVGFYSMLDMLLLSRCEALVGTYQSTFTECAWWLGGAAKPILIPKPKKILELEKEILFRDSSG